MCCGSSEPTPLPAVFAINAQVASTTPLPADAQQWRALGAPFGGPPPLRGRGFPFPKGKERQQQGLVALPLGRLQVPEAGTEARLALLQATARRCRSARVTKGRGEKLCCPPFPSLGEGKATFAARRRWPGVAWKGGLRPGDDPPQRPLPPFMPPGGGANVPLLAALQLDGVAGSRRRRGGVGTRRIFGGRHRGPWPWPRCWGRLGEWRWGPSPTKLKPGRGCVSPSHPLAPTLLGPLAPPKLRGWGTVERPRKGWKWFGPFPNAFDQAP